MRATVLIVDDSRTAVALLSRIAAGADYNVLVAEDAPGARRQMEVSFPDIVLLDLHRPEAGGVALMAELQRGYPRTQFIIVTAHGSIESAVEATRGGAFDYLTQPFEPARLLRAMENALRDARLDEEVRRLRAGLLAASTVATDAEESVRSPAMREALALAGMAAAREGIVLLLGESGTGKDHLSRWIHSRSRRASGPFFAINCAALARELAESELFGHEPGAFTGTHGRKRGLLELAEGGTLLLNEVGELDAALQAKLLSFLDTRTFVRVGGERSIRVDARIVAATNRDLAAEVEAGAFRRDLFYRLNVFPIRLPPLRERREDLPALVRDLLDRLAAEMRLGLRPAVTAEAVARLAGCPWTGNIRELRNVLERAVIVARGHPIRAEHLTLGSDDGWQLVVPFCSGKCLHTVTQEVARGLVEEALRRAPLRQDAARLLGISRHALAHQLKALGIGQEAEKEP